MADWKTSSEYQGARDSDDKQEEEVGLADEENEEDGGAICATKEAIAGFRARFRDSLIILAAQLSDAPCTEAQKQSASARAAL